MRALDPEVFDAIWSAIEPLVPVPPDTHPLGCHRRRAPDRACFAVIYVRLVTGCSWVDAERLCGGAVSDTTARTRRDEWIALGIFDALAAEAVDAYDKIVGLDLSEVCVDGSAHKAPAGGEGTGKSPVDRGKLGYRWSIATDKDGVPIGWTTDGANIHDAHMLSATLDSVERHGFAEGIETVHLDRGYDDQYVRAACAQRGLRDLVIAKRRTTKNRPAGKRRREKVIVPLGLRWPIERTNSWLSNFGQLRRNTDRRSIHRIAQLALAVAILLTAKLIDWRNRWSPRPAPIR